MVETAQRAPLPRPFPSSPKQKSISCYQQTNTRFDSSHDALHKDGPKMTAPVRVLAAEGLITLNDISVSTTQGTMKITQCFLWSLMCN